MARAITILHVEDDANDVLLFRHACKRAGLNAQVQSVTDGEEAIDYLNGSGPFADRQEYPLPALLLLDLKMPRVTGFDVLEWLRHQEELRRTPVIVLSSSNHDRDVRRAYDLGANSYLLKPVGLEGLLVLAQAIQHYWLDLNVQ